MRHYSTRFSTARPALGRRGTSIVEMVVVIAILATAMSMFAGTVGAVMVERREAREQVLAAEGAENFIERLRSVDIRQLWALYNDDPSDDPGGPRTAPGPRFAIAGLDPGDAPDGRVGEVRFPDQWVEIVETVGEAEPPEPSESGPKDKKPAGSSKAKKPPKAKGRPKDASYVPVTAPSHPLRTPSNEPQLTLQLREDLVNARLGLPRDLNGDSMIDSDDHSADYLLLPLEVSVQWRGRTGDRSLRRVTMLCELKW